MWQMLAGLGGKVVDGVANYASNKQKLKQVKLEGTIETERAKAELEVTKLKNKAEMDMTTLQAKVDKSKAIDAGNLSLDKMSMREATKSFFDEAIATLLLSPFIYLLYYNFKELPPPDQIFMAMANMPQIYWAVIIIIMMRYLSMRGTIERFAKLYFDAKSKIKVK